MGGHTNLSSSYIIIMRANFLGCTYEVFDNVFLMNSCISSVWEMFNKRWKDSVLQVSPISMDNTVRPPKRDDEWNITGNHTQALFLVWRTNYWILCSLSVLERDNCAGKHRLALGCQCKVFAAKRQCLSSIKMAVDIFVYSRMRLWYF